MKVFYIIYSRFDLQQFKGFLIQSYDPVVGAIDRGNTGVFDQVRTFFTGHIRTSDYLHLFFVFVQVYLLEFLEVPGEDLRVPFSLERYQTDQMMSP